MSVYDGYSMHGYFQEMPQVGKALRAEDPENTAAIKAIEDEIAGLIADALADGRSDESLNESGQLTPMQRVENLVDEGCFLPLNSLYNPEDNANGSTSVVKGLGRIEGRWTMIIASDNKKAAGAWVPGMPESIGKSIEAAQTLRIPLVYLLNCSGLRLDLQDKVYAGRRGGGANFFRNARLAQLSIPVIVGVFGTNPAGGGYHAISPTIICAKKDANMAVGGAGILSGMNPKGFVDQEAAEALINAQLTGPKVAAPGSAPVHHDATGFFREVFDSEEEVLDCIRRFVDYSPAYNIEYFRVAPPQEPLYDAEDLYSIIPLNPKRIYDIYDVIARLFDGSEFYEYKKGYGAEMVCGLAKADGLPVGVIANQQGLFPNYPEYKGAGSFGVGGKLYRRSLVKMNEFVTLCARDRIPMIWLQDTTGIDVGDDAEKAELLGLGQSLIYSIENANTPYLEITLRKASAAAHYVLGGPQCEKNNPFSLATAASEYYVMHSETAASALYVRQLVKAHKAGKPIDDIIAKMNDVIKSYETKSRPKYAAKTGMVDEIVDMTKLRDYITAFADAAYQNPTGVCPVHNMLTPRSIAEWDNYQK